MMESKKVIVDMIEGLSAASEENAAGSEEISAAVETQDGVIAEIANMTQNLSEMAKDLMNQAHKFKH